MTDKLEVEDVSDLIEKMKVRIRGEDRDDLQYKCLELCQTYLAGVWLNVELNDLEIERLTGGMTNQIYRCKALNTTDVKEDVVIRFYGDKYDEFKTFDKECPRFYDGIVTYIASEAGLGPKTYGLFPEGQVMKFYKVSIIKEN